MATYTVGVGGNYTTLAAAIAAAVGGDTLKVLPTFVHDGTLVLPPANVTIESSTGSASDAVIEASIATLMILAADATLRNLTIRNNYSSPGVINVLGNSGVTIEGCIIEIPNSVLGAYAIYTVGDASSIKRTTFIGGSYHILNFAAGSENWTVESCLFLLPYYAAVYNTKDNTTIKNCTVYAVAAAAGTRTAIFVEAEESEVYNTIVYAEDTNDWNYGIWVSDGFSSSDTNTVKNCIVFGGPTTADYGPGIDAPTVTANLYDTADVTADGNPVFVTIGSNYHPDTNGLAYHAGLAAGAPTLDLNGNAFDNPPSIGCLEEPIVRKTTVKSTIRGLLSSPFSLSPI